MKSYLVSEPNYHTKKYVYIYIYILYIYIHICSENLLALEIKDRYSWIKPSI